MLPTWIMTPDQYSTFDYLDLGSLYGGGASVADVDDFSPESPGETAFVLDVFRASS